jgi:hypothetical protein
MSLRDDLDALLKRAKEVAPALDSDREYYDLVGKMRASIEAAGQQEQAEFGRTIQDVRYEVDVPEVEAKLKKWGRIIAKDLPQPYGFTLFFFTFGEGGNMFYLSNARRQEMIQTMREFIQKQGAN